MSLYDYKVSQIISADTPPFYALIMAAMRGADTMNQRLLRGAFPEVWDEFKARYNAPGGKLDGELEQPRETVSCDD